MLKVWHKLLVWSCAMRSNILYDWLAKSKNKKKVHLMGRWVKRERNRQAEKGRKKRKNDLHTQRKKARKGETDRDIQTERETQEEGERQNYREINSEKDIFV